MKEVSLCLSFVGSAGSDSKMKSSGGVGEGSEGPLQARVTPEDLSSGAAWSQPSSLCTDLGGTGTHRARTEEGSVYMARTQLYNIINL